jgi:tetratricopeptide (TPR) repeat protein
MIQPTAAAECPTIPHSPSRCPTSSGFFSHHEPTARNLHHRPGRRPYRPHPRRHPRPDRRRPIPPRPQTPRPLAHPPHRPRNLAPKPPPIPTTRRPHPLAALQKPPPHLLAQPHPRRPHRSLPLPLRPHQRRRRPRRRPSTSHRTRPPTPTPTAIRTFPKEKADETLIVIAAFYRTEGVVDTNIHGEIRRAIQNKLTQLNATNIRVEIEPTPLPSGDQEAAKALGRRHNASLIIWGADTGARLEVNFLNLKEPDFAAAQATINETERTQLARPDAYTQFIINDLPNQFSFLALFAVGQSFYVQEQFDTAIILIQEAVNLVSQFETLPKEFDLNAAYFRLGYLYQETNQPQQAIANYDQAIALDPQYAAVYNNRGIAYTDLGDLEQAIADYDQALALDPQYALAYNNRGIAYADLGDLEQAIADYDQAIALDPQYAFAYNNRGFAYRNLGDLEQACRL